MGSLQAETTFPNMQFTSSAPHVTKFTPRTGSIFLKRAPGPEQPSTCLIPTPNFLTSTSRGVVPHLSRDHHNQTEAIRWVNVPFESFLDRTPPILTLQHGKNPLHTFLGFNPDRHILSMTIRDPADGKDMPPNGYGHISAYCLRGVRKVSPADWRSYVLACQPDVVVALPDIPFTNPPYSQKRLTKSIDRTIKWLADLLRPIPPPREQQQQQPPSADPHAQYRPNVLVHMAGGTSTAARRAFADNLLETLHDKEAELLAPLRRLDEGVVGYTFDLVPLRLSFKPGLKKSSEDTLPDSMPGTPPSDNAVSQDPVHVEQLVPLIQASLDPLPVSKLRMVTTATSPHEMLRLIQTCGIDLFDAYFPQQAAQIGIALDFTFPAPPSNPPHANAETQNGSSSSGLAPLSRANGKLDIGHNLYDSRYAFDVSCLSSHFSSAFDSSKPNELSTSPISNKPICHCSTCSPVSPKTRICHGSPALEAEPPVSDSGTYRPPYTRAYIHHLLHTHEMSAHSLLAMHNLTVLDAFFEHIRHVIAAPRADISDGSSFEHDVEHFFQTYDEDLVVFQEATVNWHAVDLARGKGRLDREKKNQVIIDSSAPVSD